MNVPFSEIVSSIDRKYLQLDSLRTLQINVGNKCNQACTHCHVSAGPNGTNVMTRPVMQEICRFLKKHSGLCIDVTGGCPELNPDFRFLLEGVLGHTSRLMVRTNLTVLIDEGLEWIPQWYRQHGVCIAASFPCYTQDNLDSQRGNGVFVRSIEAIRMLNDLGYGHDDGLELNLIYNPGSGSLPGDQQELETAYKTELGDRFGIVFDRLFTITNAPIGRFKRHLEVTGSFKSYMRLLFENFSPEAAEKIMCRSLISIDYRGILYNCDFNQALDIPLKDADGQPFRIEHLENLLTGKIEIVTGAHCFCCTAGAGSSCTGALVG